MFSDFGTLAAIFDFCYVPEAQEVSRNLPGAHGFVVIQYGPMASHGDPIHPPRGPWGPAQGAQGPGPDPWAPCGHVFSQKMQNTVFLFF